MAKKYYDDMILWSCFVTFILMIDGMDHRHEISPQTGFPNIRVVHIIQNTSKNETMENYPQIYYKSNDNSSEASIHANRVLVCDDHSSAKDICSKANSSSFCASHEVYAFSFCRKSCGYCDPTDNLKHRYWRIVAGSSFFPTWPIAEIRFYDEHISDPKLCDIEEVYSSSHYSDFHHLKAFDNKNETYWIPSGWGQHENGTDWIGVKLYKETKITSLLIRLKDIGANVSPRILHIESSDKKDESYIRRWTFHYKNYSSELIARPTCPVLWKKFVGEDDTYCHRVFYKHKSWYEANAECIKHNSTLASIKSEEELNFYKKKMKIFGLVWIGLVNRKMPPKFEWVDNSKLNYTNWEDDSDIHDYDIRNNEERCVYMDKSLKWSTSYCNNRFFYACKRPYPTYDVPETDFKEVQVEAPVVFTSFDYYHPIKNRTYVLMNTSLVSNRTNPGYISLALPSQYSSSVTTHQQKTNHSSSSPQHNAKPIAAIPAIHANKEAIPQAYHNEAPIHRVLNKRKKT